MQTEKNQNEDRRNPSTSKGAPAQERRGRPRRGIRKPTRTDVRIIISLPALMTLLTIAAGIAYYRIVLDVGNELKQIHPDIDTSLAAAKVLWIMLFSSLGVFIVSVIFAYTVERPIRVMADAVASIARGDVHQQVQFRGGFELDQLGRSFNSMVNFISSMIEERDTYLTEGIQAGLMVVDMSGRITAIDATGLRILQADREQIAGRDLDYIQSKYPDLCPTFFEFCKQRLNSDSSTKPVEVDLEAPESGDIPLSVAYQFLHEVSNAGAGLVFHFRDISRRDSLNELFRRTDQLAALGTFTLGLSHELRNPLAALKGSAQLLNEAIGDEPRYQRYLNRIVREADRMDLLVRELYDYSQSPASSSEAVEFNQMISEALARAIDGLDVEHVNSIEIKKKYEQDLPKVIIQQERMMRAVGNIIINAFDHMPDGAILTLSTSRLFKHTDAPLVLDISNNGPRIPDEVLTEVFEPFHSSRPGGTGLGLAIAYQIISQNRGMLSAENMADGVNFRIVFRQLENNTAHKTETIEKEIKT